VPSGELFKIVDAKRTFLSAGYRAACDARKKEKAPESRGKGAAIQPKQQSSSNKFNQDRSNWYKLIYMLKEKTLLPCVVFAFSKRKCEECAAGLSNVDFTSGSEKSQIHIFVENSISRLKGTQLITIILSF
jgi:antiviral helicase SKI2